MSIFTHTEVFVHLDGIKVIILSLTFPYVWSLGIVVLSNKNLKFSILKKSLKVCEKIVLDLQR